MKVVKTEAQREALKPEEIGYGVPVYVTETGKTYFLSNEQYGWIELENGILPKTFYSRIKSEDGTVYVGGEVKDMSILVRNKLDVGVPYINISGVVTSEIINLNGNDKDLISVINKLLDRVTALEGGEAREVTINFTARSSSASSVNIEVNGETKATLKKNEKYTLKCMSNDKVNLSGSSLFIPDLTLESEGLILGPISADGLNVTDCRISFSPDFVECDLEVAGGWPEPSGA